MDQTKLLAKVVDLGPLEGIGLIGGEGKTLVNEVTVAGVFASIISGIIGIMTAIAFIWFIFILVTGALAWLGSGGDKAKLESAQKQITNGVIGLVLVISAIFFIKLASTLLGIPDILSVDAWLALLRLNSPKP